MIAELILTPEAGQDIEHSYAWYENQRFGLGEEFLGCVDAALQSMCRNPQLYPIIYKQYRRALVRRFPFAVFYEYLDAAIYVYSVFHTARHPDKWQHRLV